MHAEGTRPSRDPDGTRPSTSVTQNVLTAVSATSALDARRWHLVLFLPSLHVGEGGTLCALHNANGEETHACKAIVARTCIYKMPLFVWHTRRPCKIRDEARTALVRAVVVERHESDDPVERGDDGDDAGRCRSDARARNRAALAAAERLRVTVEAAGADIAREREKIFREWVSNATTRIGRSRTL